MHHRRRDRTAGDERSVWGGRAVPAVLPAAVACLLLSGCRDGVPPFTPVERITGGPTYALTFGYGQDADPR
ncbi:MAG: hypothetical protein ACREK1_12135, partial [Longimicrobiales bacterium]